MARFALAAPALAAAALLAAPALAAQPPVAYAFTVVAPRSVSPSQLVARAIVEAADARCPLVLGRTAPGRRVTVRMRALPVPEGSVGFDGVTVCRTPLPKGLTRASVAGKRLPLLPAGTPGRIALVGDTGCRVQVYPPTRLPRSRTTRSRTATHRPPGRSRRSQRRSPPRGRT